MNKINVIKLMLLILIASLFYGASCRKNRANCHSSYTIRNQTNKAIYFTKYYDSSLSRLDYNPGLSPAEYKCEANSGKNDFSNHGSCYDPEVEYFGHMYIFIFDADVIESTPWATIKQNRLFLKRFDLTKTQLDSCNWIITYP